MCLELFGFPVSSLASLNLRPVIRLFKVRFAFILSLAVAATVTGITRSGVVKVELALPSL